MRGTTPTGRGLAAAALVGVGLAIAFVAGALASPFAGDKKTTVPIVTWRPRAITLDGRSAERPFGRLIAEMASTPPWQRSARTLSAAEISDLLGRPSSAAIAPTGQTTALSIKPLGRPQICAEYLPADHSWSLVFCS
jgi:hypothetical protein